MTIKGILTTLSPRRLPWSKIALPLILILLLSAEQALFNHWMGIGFDMFYTEFFCSTWALGILLFGPALFLARRMRYLYLLIITLTTFLLISSQDIYFSYSKGFLQASAFGYAGQLSSQLPTVYSLLTLRMLAYAFPMLVVVGAYLSSRYNENSEDSPQRGQSILLMLILIILATWGYGVVAVRNETWRTDKILHPYVLIRDMNNFVYSPHELVKKIGIINYFIRDVIGFSVRREPITDHDIAFTSNWMNQRISQISQKYAGIAKGRNLIIVQVESLEASVIGASIGTTPLTPHLNILTQKGLYFPNYYALVGPGNTADAEFVTQNSLYPLSNTVAFIDYAHNTYVAMPKWLAKNGYTTAVFHDDVPTFWNRSNIYPSMGYNQIFSKKDFTPQGDLIFNHLEDKEFFRQSLGKIASSTRPFMATLITLSSHTPYVIPEHLRNLPFTEDMPFTERQKRYMESIHYTDSAIGDLIDGLKESDLYENSVIVIFGDHGSFTDIEETLEQTDGKDIANTIGDLKHNHVPLIILVPGESLKGVKTIPGSHLDLYPTIMNLLGLPHPTHTLGQDLLNTSTPVVTHRDPDSQVITSIITRDLGYRMGSTGQFEDGDCFLLPKKIKTEIAACKALYDQELTATRVSDLIVKGDLLPLLGLTQ